MFRPLLLLAALIAVPAAAAPRPQRIVSLNLCGDQFLLALADPRQIAALTRFARDPDMSSAARAARPFRAIRGSAEDVMALDPDLVITGPGIDLATTGALAGRRYRTLELPPAESYGAIVAQIRRVAAAVGHRQRGEALIARMNAQLAALPRGGRGGVSAYYQRRGFLTGSGTLIDDLMHRTGLTNLATKLGRPALSRLSLEELVAARPDYLIVDASARPADQGTELLHHPILRSIPRIELPEAWTVCGGPAYVLAARRLAEQVGR